jgi:hypothetical protein
MLGKLKGKLTGTTTATTSNRKAPVSDNGPTDTAPLSNLSNVKLISTGLYHNDVLMAKVGDDLVGGLGMEDEIDVSWYRKTSSNTSSIIIATSKSNTRTSATIATSPTNNDTATALAQPSNNEEYVKIQGVSSAYYSPSADDVGATICFRCVDKTNPSNQGFAQIGPLLMEPAVSEGVTAALTSQPPGGSFKVSMPSLPGKTIQLNFDKTTVELLDSSSDGSGGEGDEGGEVVFSCCHVDGVAVIIDAATPTGMDVVGFTVPAHNSSSSSSDGSDGSDGTGGDNATNAKVHGVVHTRVKICTNSPRDRDIISLSLRALCDAARSKYNTTSTSGRLVLMKNIVLIDDGTSNGGGGNSRRRNNNQQEAEVKQPEPEPEPEEVGAFGCSIDNDSNDNDNSNDNSNDNHTTTTPTTTDKQWQQKLQHLATENGSLTTQLHTLREQHHRAHTTTRQELSAAVQRLHEQEADNHRQAQQLRQLQDKVLALELATTNAMADKETVRCVLLCTVVYCCVLLCTVVYCGVLLCTVVYCGVLWCIVVYCGVLLFISVPLLPSHVWWISTSTHIGIFQLYGYFSSRRQHGGCDEFDPRKQQQCGRGGKHGKRHCPSGAE